MFKKELVVLLILTITVYADDHSHFDAESAKPGVILSVPFRSDSDITRYSQGLSNDCTSYDSSEDAANIVFSDGSSDMCTQVRPVFGQQLTQVGDELWVQWETKWDSGWSEDTGDLRTHKAFQLADGGTRGEVGSGGIKFEIKSNYGKVDTTAIGTPSFRVYRWSDTDGDNGGDLRDYSCPYGAYGNGQPGGETWLDNKNSGFGADDHLANMDEAYCHEDIDNPFVYLTDTWIRFTVKFTKASNGERVTVWMDDGQNGPVIVLGSLNQDGTGFWIDYNDDEGFNQFWFEFDSSQETMSPGTRNVYFRNLIVSTEEIALESAQDGIYVSVTGSDSATGTSDDPLKTISEALTRAQAGERVIIREGTYNEKVVFPRDGSYSQRITLKALDGEEVTIKQTGTVMEINKRYITVENIILDGNWGASDLLRVGDNADYLVIKDCELKNTMRDAVDMGGPDGVLIEGCKIHDAIWFSGGNREDAHGIVTTGVQDLTIRDTEIYYVSGDTLQFQYDGWDNVLIENCRLWNGPLPSARGGAPAGANVGENAVDTKYYEADGRGKLTLKNITAYGWVSDYISNAAAFNLKHNIEATVDAVECYDSEICFRVRGPGGDKGGAWVTIMNAIMYDSEKAVRYEDSIENLKIYNNIFGDGLNKLFESAGGHGSGFDVRNNLFLGSVPSDASDGSNLAVESDAFLDISSGDYHPVEDSPALDNGIEIPEVMRDFDGKVRPGGAAYDVGAFEGAGACIPMQITEIKSHIDSWLRGDLSLSGIMAKVNKWKEDCA